MEEAELQRLLDLQKREAAEDDAWIRNQEMVSGENFVIWIKDGGPESCTFCFHFTDFIFINEGFRD